MGFYLQQIMVKPTKRKAFNFLRSYYDVLNELKEPDDKLNFLISIIDKQFIDEDPKELNFIVNLCYESQRHAIESSVKGWKRASKTDLIGNPMTDPLTLLPTDLSTPYKEEEVKEEEKEKEEVEVKLDSDCLYNIDKLQEFYLSKEVVVDSIISEPKNKIKNKEHLISRLKEFKVILTNQGRLSEKYGEYTRYFLAWNRKAPLKQITNKRPTDNITS